MNILHMIDSEGMFGAEYVIYYLLPVLRNLGVNVYFACMCPIDSPGADLGRRLEHKGVPVFYLNERKKLSTKGFHSIYRALRTSQADILHVHGYKATILGGFISRLIGVPMVTTYHAEAETYHGFKYRTYGAIETCFLKRASRVIAVSKLIKNGLISRGIPADQVSVIANGIDDLSRGFNVNARNNSPHVLCIGRLIQLKRFDLVIKAISILKDEFPDLHLTIAGSGPLEDKLKWLADDLGISDRVSLPGYVIDPRELLSQADVFVLASETEGSPIVLLEAMIFSLPIIASKVGAIPDMLNGLNGTTLIKPGDQNQLLDALRCLLAAPVYRQSLGSAARHRYEKEFTSEIMASRYMSQYKACLDNKH
jgi:glycosyltransferase involved in cell wall biosynthesis